MEFSCNPRNETTRNFLPLTLLPASSRFVLRNIRNARHDETFTISWKTCARTILILDLHRERLLEGSAQSGEERASIPRKTGGGWQVEHGGCINRRSEWPRTRARPKRAQHLKIACRGKRGAPRRVKKTDILLKIVHLWPTAFGHPLNRILSIVFRYCFLWRKSPSEKSENYRLRLRE